jgi:hypothetical protein
MRLGGVITAGRTPTSVYCTAQTFTVNLDDCLSCALTYDIWKMYGNSVTKAAEACKLTATPSPASAVASSTGAVNATIPTNTTSHSHGASETISHSHVDSGTTATTASVGSVCILLQANICYAFVLIMSVASFVSSSSHILL